MDLVQLRTLVHVAELGSLRKASQRLNLVQPALSRHIKLLEEELGVHLFRRHGRGMVITQVGEDVVQHAKGIFGQIEAIKRSVSLDVCSVEGLVSIGLTPSISRLIEAPLIERVRQDYPKLALRFQSGFSGPTLDWLKRGEVDVVVTCDPKPAQAVRIQPLLREDLYLVRLTQSDETVSGSIKFADLQSEKLVLQGVNHGIRSILQECAKSMGIAIRPTVESDSFHSILNLVLNGVGASVLPLAWIRELIVNGTLVASKIVDPTPSRIVAVAYSAHKECARARIVADAIRVVSEDLMGRRESMGCRSFGQ